MMKKRKWIWTTALAAILMSVSIMTAAAADRVITSVTIRVNSKLEPGSTLPDIGLDSGSVESGEISVSSSTNRYTVDRAEWVTSTSRTIEVGDRPEMKVWLRAGSEDYFKGTYRSSNVSVKSGDFVSAKR